MLELRALIDSDISLIEKWQTVIVSLTGCIIL